MINEVVYLGIDVAKAELVISPLSGVKPSVANTTRSIRPFLRSIQALGQPVVLCCEASGGYEKRLIELALEMEVPVALLNPKRVRDFARSEGLLAKTDQIDARTIAQFAAEKKPSALERPPEWLKELQDLVVRRENLKVMRTSESNRLDPEPSKAVVRSIRRVLKMIDTEIARISRQIEDLVESHDFLSEASKKLQQVKAIGPVTAQTLLASVPELGRLSDKKITGLVGLAPYCDDSGTRKGRRYIQGGRALARNSLYMAALVASRRNPILSEFYNRLKMNGKPSKLALTAVMRKILVLANRIMADPDFKLA